MSEERLELDDLLSTVHSELVSKADALHGAAVRAKMDPPARRISELRWLADQLDALRGALYRNPLCAAALSADPRLRK